MSEIRVTAVLSAADVERIADRLAEKLAPLLRAAEPVVSVAVAVEVEVEDDDGPQRPTDFAAGIADETAAAIIQAAKAAPPPYNSPERKAERKAARFAAQAGLRNVTADLCGDPAPGRSALDHRNGAIG